MNYIINPSWFYWINVVDNFRVFSIVCAIVCGACCLLMIIPISEEYDDSEIAKWEKRQKICFILCVILSAVLVLIPSKNTLIEMMIAKQATYENAQWTLETLKSAVDYIVNAIKSVK